ncbi:glycosyltransferase family 2 protein [Geomonas edaphica]|uniref:glycosyltransferase family 2 protein n=1 Tax=Geomonas edaphica TaxID=2570226 RepID=UPI0010A92E3B|nr:glycosyltransferase family A protein [Geomonas edaphica]
MSAPVVSVVLPVYNGDRFLEESLQSILRQSFTDLELIVINDGSTDGTREILERYCDRDPRLRVWHQENRGLSRSLNVGLELARGRYLARQDADDVSLPERIAKQVAFLDAHPDYCMVGTWSHIIEEQRHSLRFHRHPAENGPLKFNLLFDNFFVHTSVMVRKSALDAVGAYTTAQVRQPEDYELWSRLLRGRLGKMANLPEVLVEYREVEGSICRSDSRSFTDQVMAISRLNLAAFSGREPEDQLVADLSALVHGVFDQVSTRPDFAAIFMLLRRTARGVIGEAEATPMGEVYRLFFALVKGYVRYRLRNLRCLRLDR